MATTAYGNHTWINKIPYTLQNMEFSPIKRVLMQLVISVVMIGSLYFTYTSVDDMVSAVGVQKVVVPEDFVPPTWTFLVFPVLALIPCVYVFYFLRYNFLQ